MGERRAQELVPPTKSSGGSGWTRGLLVGELAMAAATGLTAMVTAMLVTGLLPRTWRSVWAENDAMGIYTYAVNLSRGRWYLVNPDLGYPGFQDHGHFPLTDLVSLGQIGLLAQLLPPVMAVNIFTLGTFFTVAATTYLAGRYAGTIRWVAVVVALAFALLPWHFDRAREHLWLASYMSVPLTIFLIVVIARGDLYRGTQEGPDRFRRRVVRVCAVAAAVVIGANGVYYAAMSTILLSAVVAFGSLRARRLVTGWLGLFVIATVPLTVLVQLVLSKLSISTRSTGATIVRSADDALLYGGDITSLFRPSNRTLSGQLLGRVLDLGFPSVSEGDAMYNLATVTAVVVTCVLVGLRYASSRQPGQATALRAARFWPGLFLLVLLFTARGGLGALFSRWISNEIRSWGRYSIFLAGIALLVLGLAITAWSASPLRRTRVAATLLGALVAVSAFADVATGSFHRDVRAYQARATELEAYIAAVEELAPPGCAVLQLPIVRFPEEPKINAMGEYAHFWTYLYSHHLRWSYGAFKGTEFGDWGASIKDDPQALLAQARKAGFCGIQIDTWSWTQSADGLPALEAFGWPEVASSSGRWLYFGLEGPRPGEYTYQPASGFSLPERGPDGVSRWGMTDPEAVVAVTGRAGDRVDVALRLAAVADCGPTVVRVAGKRVGVAGSTTKEVPVELDGSGQAEITLSADRGACATYGSGRYVDLLIQQQLDIAVPASGV